MNNKLFFEVWNKNIEKLESYTPVVERVHGKSHPEFYKVRSLFDQINEKNKNQSDDLDLAIEFNELRKSTNNYQIPNDVCETYEAVYNMLEELDKAYFDK